MELLHPDGALLAREFNFCKKRGADMAKKSGLLGLTMALFALLLFSGCQGAIINVEGRVLQELVSGTEPAPGVRVQFVSEKQQSYQSTTDELGNFVVLDIPSGAYNVRVFDQLGAWDMGEIVINRDNTHPVFVIDRTVHASFTGG